MVGKKGLEKSLTSYGDADFALYLRRSFARSMGYSRELLERPVVGITNTTSDFNNCHRHFPELIEAVKRGVLTAGGLPLAFPTISLGEVFLHPTSLMFRNLMAMDTEEMVRAQPMDAVVLLGGCDKTVPAQLMGALSANRPAIQLVAGPMLTSRHRGERLGACTDCRRFWARFRSGEIDADEIEEVEAGLATTAGTCAVMGTASTMAAIAETLGMMLPGTATIPAVHADRLRAAEASGVAAVEMARAERTPDRIITPQSVENALRVLLAIGGSTNAILHLTAIAGRAGIDLGLARLNELSDDTPVLVDLKPTGEHYMEDLFAAGGIGAVLQELRPMLHLGCLTVSGETLGERLSEAAGYVDRRVVRPLSDPVQERGGARGPLRIAGSTRRHPEALGSRSQALRARGACARLRNAGRPRGSHRRTRPGRERRRHPGPAERGTEEPLRHARGRLSADPSEAGPRGCPRHAAHLRRAHEWNRLRERRSPRLTRRGQRRSARRRADGRPHSRECHRAEARPAGAPGRTRTAPAPALRAAGPWLRPAASRAGAAGG